MESDHITKRSNQLNIKIIFIVVPDFCNAPLQFLFVFCRNPDNVA